MFQPRDAADSCKKQELTAANDVCAGKQRRVDPRMLRLTQRQLVVVETIARLIALNGYPPSLRELGDACGMGYTGARETLIWLERKGYVTRKPGVVRSIRLLAGAL